MRASIAQGSVMSHDVLIGALLIAVGCVDELLAFVVLGPRIADPSRRRVVVRTLASRGALTMVAGGLVLAGLIP